MGDNERRELKAMRLAAHCSAERMAEKLGIDPDTFRSLEAGELVADEDLLAEWQRAVALALSHAARHRASASRGLRRWLRGS